MEYIYNINDLVSLFNEADKENERVATMEGKDNRNDMLMLKLFLHLCFYGITDEETMNLNITDYDYTSKKLKGYDVELEPSTIELIESSCRATQATNGKFYVGTKLIRGITDKFDIGALLHQKAAMQQKFSPEFKAKVMNKLTYRNVAKQGIFNRMVKIENSGKEIFKSGLFLNEIVRVMHIMPTTVITDYKKGYKAYKENIPQVKEIVPEPVVDDKSELIKMIENIESELAILKQKLNEKYL